MKKLNLQFQIDKVIYKGISFDIKTNTLSVSQYDLENNFIKNTTLRMGQIPKKVKQKLNPLK